MIVPPSLACDWSVSSTACLMRWECAAGSLAVLVPKPDLLRRSSSTSARGRIRWGNAAIEAH
jgi:hypothetical protein